MSEDESGPAKPGRRRFLTTEGSVAPALRTAARFVLQVAVVVVIRTVIDQLMP